MIGPPLLAASHGCEWAPSQVKGLNSDPPADSSKQTLCLSSSFSPPPLP